MRRSWSAKVSLVKATPSLFGAEISADGKYVVFTSEASNLVANDINGLADIFRYEVATGNIALVSATTEVRSNGTSDRASISSDGRYISFTSTATNLVGADNESAEDIYWRDMVTGELAVLTATGNGFATNSSISANGRFITFRSNIDNLPSQNGSAHNIYMKDIYGGAVTNITSLATGYAHAPSVSADGRYVVYHTTNHSGGGVNNNVSDIFMRDTWNNSTTLISKQPNGQPANNYSYDATITPDGRYVVYHSLATNISADDGNAFEDIFVWDRVTGKSRLVTRDVNGAETDGHSLRASISADAKYVTFYSFATDLNAADTS